MDLLEREGKYPLPPQAPKSKTMGVEFSGTIVSLGPESNGDFKVGDAVFGLAYGGLSLPLPNPTCSLPNIGLDRCICGIHCRLHQHADSQA